MKTYFLDVLAKHYVDFKGCATRKQYWLFVLCNLIVSFILGMILGITGISSDVAFIVNSIYSLALLLPSLGIAVRRLHDAGFSGWWILLGLIPFAGALVLLIFFCLPTKK